MPTLIYKGSECRRLTKGTMITVVPKHGTANMSPYDIEDALKQMGFEHDEIQHCRNLKDWETPEEMSLRLRREAEMEQEEPLADNGGEGGLTDFFKTYFTANLQIAAVVLLGVPFAGGIEADPLITVLTCILCIAGGLYLPLKGLNCIRGGKMSYREVLGTLFEIRKDSFKDWWNQHYAPNSPKSKTFVKITAILAAITLCISFIGGMIELEMILIAVTVLAAPVYYTFFYVTKKD